jgi:hypothetical protein
MDGKLWGLLILSCILAVVPTALASLANFRNAGLYVGPAEIAWFVSTVLFWWCARTKWEWAPLIFSLLPIACWPAILEVLLIIGVTAGHGNV